MVENGDKGVPVVIVIESVWRAAVCDEVEENQVKLEMHMGWILGGRAYGIRVSNSSVTERSPWHRTARLMTTLTFDGKFYCVLKVSACMEGRNVYLSVEKRWANYAS